jgi:hypothetical protein
MPASPKPARGTLVLEREARRKAIKDDEIAVSKAVKERDHYRCRWPEAHKCRGGLEAAHIRDKSLCGPTITSNEITFCAWIHRRGPHSIHGKQLKVTCDTPDGADGPCGFWKQASDSSYDGYYLVARERAIGILEHD